jgi:hypothetical protein
MFLIANAGVLTATADAAPRHLAPPRRLPHPGVHRLPRSPYPIGFLKLIIVF